METNNKKYVAAWAELNPNSMPGIHLCSGSLGIFDTIEEARNAIHSCILEDVLNAFADYDIENDPLGYNGMKPEDIAKDWIDYEDDTEVLVIHDNEIRCHYSINIF